MPHDPRPPLPGEDCITTSLQTSQRSCKRKRTPSTGGKKVAHEAARTEEAESDSSDWEDWADALVAQGNPMDETEKNQVSTDKSGVVSTENGTDAEEEAWMKGMMDQGTDGSVVQEMDTKAWEYVLQVAVEADEQASDAMLSSVQEVRGLAATEIIARWLELNLPNATPTIKMLRKISLNVGASCGYGGVANEGRDLLGWAVADSITNPSAVAVVSRSMEQIRAHISLFSLSANSGAALGAALVQPGASGLLRASLDVMRDREKLSRAETGVWGRGPCDGTRHSSKVDTRGFVIESLDSRVMEEALVSAMRRLGLGIKCRSRSGMWKLSGTKSRISTLNVQDVLVSSLVEEDAQEVVRQQTCDGVRGGVEDREGVIRGMIRRNPSAGIRREGRLVAWCTLLDCGLLVALHVTESGLWKDDVCALLSAVLDSDPSLACPTPPGTGVVATFIPNDAAMKSPVMEMTPTVHPAAATSSDRLCIGRGAAFRGLVLDDESPLAEVAQDLGFERICDADWMQFVPCSAESMAEDEQLLPVSALVMLP